MHRPYSNRSSCRDRPTASSSSPSSPSSSSPSLVSILASAAALALAVAGSAAPGAFARKVDSAGHFRPELSQNSKAIVDNCQSSVVIQEGDTCVSLATRIGISLSKFRSLNTFIDCNNLPAGQIACAAAMDDTSPKNALGDMTNCLSNYTIQADDRCEAVAFQFQLTVTQLLQLNTYLDCVNLVSGSIVCVNGYVGNPPQLVPASASNATANATVVPVDGCLQLVTVSSSQNCIALTVRYGISVTDLYSWNANLNCWAFKNGDRVCVKAPATASIARNSTTSATSTSSKSSSSFSSTSSSSTSTTSTTSTVEITYPTTTEAPPEPTPTPTPEPQPQPQPDNSDEGATLSKHNSYRAQYGIPALSWSSGLAGEASSYASYLAYSNNCALVHSGASGEGENLASYGATAGAGHMAMSAAVDSWMTEDVNHYEHASQVVWRGSHEVGCGIATNTHSDGSFCEVVVCRYSPQGNIAPLQYYNS